MYERTAMKCPKNRRKKKFEPKYCGRPCRKVFAFHQTCATPFALNHDINSMRARSAAQTPRYCGQLDLTTITDYTCANRGDDAYMLRESFGWHLQFTHTPTNRRPYVGIHEMHKSEQNVSDANALTQNRWVTTWPDDANNDSITKFCTSSIDASRSSYGDLRLVHRLGEGDRERRAGRTCISWWWKQNLRGKK